MPVTLVVFPKAASAEPPPKTSEPQQSTRPSFFRPQVWATPPATCADASVSFALPPTIP